MRRKLLSFIIVSAAVLTAGTIYHGIARMDGDGTAQASLGAMGEAGSNVNYAGRRTLVRDISLHPAKLLTVRGQDVKAALREPELVRHEAPTTIWQYRTDACVLDIYFSGNSDPLLLPVTHYEIRARTKGGSDDDMQAICVSELARKSGRPRMVDVSALYKRN